MALPVIPIIIGLGVVTMALVSKSAASTIPPSPSPVPGGGGGGTIPGAADPTAGYVVVPIESVSKSTSRPTHEELVSLFPGRIILAYMAVMRNSEPTKVIRARLIVTERAVGDLSGEDNVKAKFVSVDEASPISFKAGDPVPKEGTVFPVTAKQILFVEKPDLSEAMPMPKGTNVTGRIAFWRTRR